MRATRTRHGFGPFILATLFALACPAHGDGTDGATLRVCADPNNLPFSNRAGAGFENRLAGMLADALDLELDYTWHAQRRGFLRNTLNAGVCDVVMGVPADLEMVLATRPYYRSTYVFLHAATLEPAIVSFDDARLRQQRIGIHLVGDDGSNTPPEMALAVRGIIDNVAGYMIQGDYREPNPPARLVEAVAKDEVDVAALWGPIAGYFASRQQKALTLTPVEPAVAPFTYAIALGVRREDVALKDQLDTVLLEQRDAIDALLREYGIPLLPLHDNFPEDDNG